MYTKVLSLTVLLLLSFTQVFAWDEVKNTSTSPLVWVQSYNFNMSADYRDGQVYLTWSPFNDRANFKWYKLAFSRENSRPLYPQDTNNFVWDVVSESSYSFWPNTADYIYVNLCAVTHNDTVYCDSGKKVLLPKTEVKTTPKTQEKNHNSETIKQETEKRLEELREKAQEKKEEVNKKVEDKKTEVTQKVEEKRQEVQTRLSDNIQKRANAIIDTFLIRLENQNLTVDQTVTRINTVISRLENLSTQVRFRQLSWYMIEKLEMYKLELDSGLSEIEAIFNNLR